eukprot:SAG11_NODE_34748_length_270_cov_0.853801_1_plen_47_part_10
MYGGSEKFLDSTRRGPFPSTYAAERPIPLYCANRTICVVIETNLNSA